MGLYVHDTNPLYSWHWSLWEILWASGPVFVLWFFCLPETSASNILLRRAARLRKASGNDKIRSQTEIDRQGITFKQIAIDAVVKPIEISLKDPAVCLGLASKTTYHSLTSYAGFIR
jgi:DHA1 family multidrug resistance protein-like MFS transporter